MTSTFSESEQASAPVLVVDDDPATRLLLRKILRQSGFAVDIAAGGSEALSLVADRQYGAILLDLVMPQPDGLAVLRQIRSTAPALLDRIIIITGYPQQAVAADAYAILTKPLDIAEVMRLTRLCAGKYDR